MQVLYSREGSLAHRPAGICKAIGTCTDNCNTADKNTIDFCSPTGLASGAVASPVVSMENGICKSTSDCTETQYCSMEEITSSCQCDSTTGYDTCTRLGTCRDFCDQYDKQIEEFNSRIITCMETADCPASHTCKTEEIAACKQMSCTAAGGIAVSTCPGMCVPSSRTLNSAEFDNDGNKIRVALNFPTPRETMDCGTVFDAASVQLLGSTSQCFAEGKNLTIVLRKGASVVSGDTLVLKTDQAVLNDIFGQPFTGNVVVSICTACTLPEVHTTYPKLLSPGCDGGAGEAVFDASYSTDTSGRSLAYAWSLDTSSCYRSDSSVDFSSAAACAEIEDAIAVGS